MSYIIQPSEAQVANAKAEANFWREAFFQLARQHNQESFVVNRYALPKSDSYQFYLEELKGQDSKTGTRITWDNEPERVEKLANTLKTLKEVPTPELLKKAYKKAFGDSLD